MVSAAGSTGRGAPAEHDCAGERGWLRRQRVAFDRNRRLGRDYGFGDRVDGFGHVGGAEWERDADGGGDARSGEWDDHVLRWNDRAGRGDLERGVGDPDDQLQYNRNADADGSLCGEHDLCGKYFGLGEPDRDGDNFYRMQRNAGGRGGSVLCR